MANAKIISFVDSQVREVMDWTRSDLAAARTQTTHDISFVALNLRHDIKILNDLIRDLRQGLTALATAVDQQHNVLRALTAGINELREDVEKLKQARGEGPPLSA